MAGHRRPRGAPRTRRRQPALGVRRHGRPLRRAGRERAGRGTPRRNGRGTARRGRPHNAVDAVRTGEGSPHRPLPEPVQPLLGLRDHHRDDPGLVRRGNPPLPRRSDRHRFGHGTPRRTARGLCHLGACAHRPLRRPYSCRAARRGARRPHRTAHRTLLPRHRLGTGQESRRHGPCGPHDHRHRAARRGVPPGRPGTRPHRLPDRTVAARDDGPGGRGRRRRGHRVVARSRRSYGRRPGCRTAHHRDPDPVARGHTPVSQAEFSLDGRTYSGAAQLSARGVLRTDRTARYVALRVTTSATRPASLVALNIA